MKPATLFCLIVILLLSQACNSSVPTSPSITTQTVGTPSITSPTTVAITPTAPVETPTTEASPTPAAPKEGDTMVENGYTYTYTVIRSPDTKETLYTGWFRKMTLTALPLWDWSTYVPDGSGGWKVGQDVGPIQVLVEKGVPGADTIRSLEHTQYPDGQPNNNEYMETLYPLISKRFLGKWLDAASNEEWRQLQVDLQDGKPDTAMITFTVNGKEYQWSPGPNVGSVVYVLNWDHAAPTKENGFVEWKDNTNTDRFRTAFWGIDDKGNILGAIASEKPLNELTYKQIRMMVLYDTIQILVGKDMTDVGYGAVLNDFADISGKDNPPVIEIHKNNQ